MLVIQATEAKARLAELLRAVERGETGAITKRGHAVAHMVPAPEKDESISYQRAVEDFLEICSKWEPCPVSIEEAVRARNEGRRH